MRRRSTPAITVAATRPAGRLLLAIALVLFAVAILATATALRARPTVLEVHSTMAAPPTSALDAAGCPTRSRCEFRASVPAGIKAAIGRAFPPGTLLWQSTTADAASGQIYRVTAISRPAPDVTLVFTAQCDPNSTERGTQQRTSSAQQRSDLAGNQVALNSVQDIRVPGARGCEVSAQLSAPGDGQQYQAALARLAHDPAAQVSR